MRAITGILAPALGVALLCAGTPACTKSSASTAPKVKKTAAGAPRKAPAAGSKAPADASEGKAEATGELRRHPFMPVFSAGARKTSVSKQGGPLTLKGILGGEPPIAIIQEGTETHFVKQQDEIGSYVVLRVGKDEVVLGTGRRKRVLSLYER